MGLILQNIYKIDRSLSPRLAADSQNETATIITNTVTVYNAQIIHPLGILNAFQYRHHILAAKAKCINNGVARVHLLGGIAHNG